MYLVKLRIFPCHGVLQRKWFAWGWMNKSVRNSVVIESSKNVVYLRTTWMLLTFNNFTVWFTYLLTYYLPTWLEISSDPKWIVLFSSVVHGNKKFKLKVVA